MKKLLIEDEVPDDAEMFSISYRIPIEPDGFLGYRFGYYRERNPKVIDNIIHAKALRKRGTDKWYHYEDIGKDIGGWMTCQLPKLLADTATMKDYKALSKKGLVIKPPPDAELIDIKIIIEQER